MYWGLRRMTDMWLVYKVSDLRVIGVYLKGLTSNWGLHRVTDGKIEIYVEWLTIDRGLRQVTEEWLGFTLRDWQ